MLITTRWKENSRFERSLWSIEFVCLLSLLLLLLLRLLLLLLLMLINLWPSILCESMKKMKCAHTKRTLLCMTLFPWGVQFIIESKTWKQNLQVFILIKKKKFQPTNIRKIYCSFVRCLYLFLFLRLSNNFEIQFCGKLFVSFMFKID